MKVGRRSANNRTVLDACGRSVLVGLRPMRIVSLVPSLTELVFALGAGECVVGATRFCVEPRAARSLPRVGGTKTPDVRAIRELGADLVLANVEENRREDVEALVAAGVSVYVTAPRTVVEGIKLAAEIGALVGQARRGRDIADRLEKTRAAVAAEAGAGRRVAVFCPIWRRPWMSFNAHTFAHDMLATAGGDNVVAELPEAYPVVEAATIQSRRPDVVLLPSEPYRFGPRDLDPLAELLATPGTEQPRVRFIDGRALTWYGPRIDWGLRVLRASLTLVATE